jgi:hypothetical protein
MTPRSEKQIDEIYEVLMGDPIKGIPGLFHRHNRIVEDLYGIGMDGKEIEGKKNTISLRISNLENNQKKVIWTITGVCGAFTAIKLGCVALFTKIFER